jgi:predicted phosphodiesterase
MKTSQNKEYYSGGVYVLGDIHGEYSELVKASELLPENSLIIQVGDFGLGFNVNSIDKENLNLFTKNAYNKNTKCYVIRGNHDDPSYFDNGPHYHSSQITLLKDYTSKIINDKQFLFIGGATSIDRYSRIVGIDYWPDEHLNYDTCNECDILITHTCPSFCFPCPNKVQLYNIVQNYCDEQYQIICLVEDLMKEREIADVIFHNAKPKKLYYGHFHNSNNEIINDCECILLDIDELKEIII